MRDALIQSSADNWAAILRHLNPVKGQPEQAAFAFMIEAPGAMMLEEWWPVESAGFAHQSQHYLELVDGMRGSLIKHAHDLGAGLIEFHSHPGQASARFSWSDVSGFSEWVPHVKWRLPGRPYIAVVVGASSFDSLVWLTGSGGPDGVSSIRVGGLVHRPTSWSFTNWEDLLERPAL